jgi:hypothetical protein
MKAEGGTRNAEKGGVGERRTLNSERRTSNVEGRLNEWLAKSESEFLIAVCERRFGKATWLMSRTHIWASKWLCMQILYPKIRVALLPSMFGYAALGGLVAGVYGIVHDQITYSISHEYFTRLKFAQFHYANFGLAPRFFVAEIGFLASWWVGFFAAWFIARITVPAFPRNAAFRYTIQGFAIVFSFTLLGSVAGYIFGLRHGSDYSAWEDFISTLRIVDVRSFVRAAYIHNASYLGGGIGLVAAIIYVWRLRNSEPSIGGNAERGGGI